MTQEEMERRIAEIKKQLKELEKQLEELKAMPEEKRWKPKEEEEYWVVDEIFNVGSFYWYNDERDNLLYSHFNCFKTQEEAEERAKQLKMQAKYRIWCEEYSEPIDWNDSNQQKFKAVYDNIDKEIHICADYYVLYQGGVYASSKEIIQDFIDKVGEKDFIKYVLEVEE